MPGHDRRGKRDIRHTWSGLHRSTGATVAPQQHARTIRFAGGFVLILTCGLDRCRYRVCCRMCTRQRHSQSGFPDLLQLLRSRGPLGSAARGQEVQLACPRTCHERLPCLVVCSEASHFKTGMKPSRREEAHHTQEEAAQMVEASAERGVVCRWRRRAADCSWQWSNEPLLLRPTKEPWNASEGCMSSHVQWEDST